MRSNELIQSNFYDSFISVYNKLLETQGQNKNLPVTVYGTEKFFKSIGYNGEFVKDVSIFAKRINKRRKRAILKAKIEMSHYLFKKRFSEMASDLIDTIIPTEFNRAEFVTVKGDIFKQYLENTIKVD